MAWNNIPKCRNILREILDKYDIKGLQSLFDIKGVGAENTDFGPFGNQEFDIEIYLKNDNPTEPGDPKPSASIRGIADRKILSVDYLSRDRSDVETKGAGKLLLGLVACRAAELGLRLTLQAAHGSVKSRSPEQLFKFYNNFGLTRSGPVVGMPDRDESYTAVVQYYNTTPETLRSLFIGGGNKNNTLKVENMSLSIVADGTAHDLSSLTALLSVGPTPDLIKVNNGAKFIKFIRGDNGMYNFSREQVGRVPVKQNALSAIDNVIAKITSEFSVVGGRRFVAHSAAQNSRRRRSRRSRSRKTRKYRK